MRMHISNVLKECMSSDNTVRQKAEHSFNQALELDPRQTATELMQVISSPAVNVDTQSRGLATVLMRKKFCQNKARYGELGETFHVEVKKQLLKQFHEETNDKNMRYLCDLIVEVASVHSGTWSELIQFLCKAYNANLKLKSVLYVMGELVHYLHASMSQDDIKQIIQMSGTAFNNPDTGVQIAALMMFGKAVVFIKETAPYCTVVDSIINMMSALCTAKDWQSAQSVLQVCIDIALEEASFFGPKLSEILGMCNKIGMSQEMDEDMRMMALELLITILEKAPKMVRRNKTFLATTTQIGLQMMLVVDDDLEEWNSAFDTNVDDSPCFDAGQVSVNRLAENLSTKKYLPILMPKIYQLLEHQDWTCKHAAIIAIAQTCELISEGKLDKSEIIKQILLHNNHPHPRVRYAAVHCVGIMCSDFGKRFVNKWHVQIIETFLNAMGDFENPRVQANAAICVVNLAERISSKLLMPYMENLLQKLFQLLNQANIPKFVQENALSAISEIAENAEEHFIKYYDTFVTPLMNILMNAKGEEFLDLRLEALRCLTYIGVAVGPKKFGPQAKLAIEVSLPIIKEDGVEVMRILNSWKRVFSTMQDEITNYLAPCADVVLKHASQEVALEEWDSDYEDDEDFDINTREIPVNASKIEEKVSALNLVYAMAKYSGGAFYPLVEQAGGIILPLISEPTDDLILEAAAEALPGLVFCTWDAYRKNPQQVPMDRVVTIFRAVLEKIINQVPKETVPECLCAFCICIDKTVKHDYDLCKRALTEKLLVDLSTVLFKCLRDSSERMDFRNRQIIELQQQNADEEDIEEVKRDNEQEAQLSTHVSDAVGSLIRIYKDSFLPLLSRSMDSLSYMLSNEGLDIQKRAALYIFCDVIEHCSNDSIASLMDFLSETFINCCSVNDSCVRQAGLYGIGILAERCTAQLRVDPMALVKLSFNQWNGPFVTSDDAKDNAALAIGRVCKACPGLPLDKIFPEWLNCFPIRIDSDCSIWCYKELLRLIDNNNQAILGPNTCHLPKIISFIAEAVFTDMSDDSLDKLFCSIMTKIKSTPHAPAVFGALDSETKEKLAKQANI